LGKIEENWRFLSGECDKTRGQTLERESKSLEMLSFSVIFDCKMLFEKF
jgi:hypothetical protein